MSDQLLQLELAKLKAENAALKAKALAKNKITFKVSEKGACSIYGLGRFPVTLYKSQMIRLIECMPELKTFIEANAELLKEKVA